MFITTGLLLKLPTIKLNFYSKYLIFLSVVVKVKLRNVKFLLVVIHIFRLLIISDILCLIYLLLKKMGGEKIPVLLSVCS
jgi:hypothetical protein